MTRTSPTASPKRSASKPKINQDGKTKAVRTKGRPTLSEPKIGREIILEKTCELLRNHPPSEVTRVMAARANNVHPSLIHYYFKTRSSLMIAAAEQLSVEYRRTVASRMENVTGSPQERLRARVEVLIDLELTHPYFHRLLVEEVLTSDDPEALSLSQGLGLRGISRYREIIEDGVKAGELRNVDGGWLFTSIISLCQFFERAKVLYRGLAHAGVSDDELEKSYRDFLIDFVMSAVSVRPPTDQQSAA